MARLDRAIQPPRVGAATRELYRQDRPLLNLSNDAGHELERKITSPNAGRSKLLAARAISGGGNLADARTYPNAALRRSRLSAGHSSFEL